MHTQLAAELGECSDVRFALEPIDEHDIGPNVRKRAHLSAAASALEGRVPCECIASTGATTRARTHTSQGTGGCARS